MLANQLSAEFGEALATVTSAVTKAGTNAFRGSGLFFVQDDALNATPAFAPRKPPPSAQQFGFTLGRSVRQGPDALFGQLRRPAIAPPQHRGLARRARRRGARRRRRAPWLLQSRPPARPAPPHDDPLQRAVLSLAQRDRRPERLPGYGHPVHERRPHASGDERLSAVEPAAERGAVPVRPLRRHPVRSPADGLCVAAGYSKEGGTLGRFGFGADPEDTLGGRRYALVGTGFAMSSRRAAGSSTSGLATRF